ncbi:MazG family protein [Saccharothrix coeruleofusca]|uniref:Nucleoside triphosphate pyrophosphohydrolase n=1 Tax=Saccharothrix coeruleofusca TaxID=33919 RepID=A0A918APG9_9PSEU|nr:MazG family protein [Saccharothrix coeruleofusca]MBP2340770.1 XTP/dITP diphosphohydrolase [Saccharothrix coeruleofusca]GGP59690.1 nucleoside triphosphate pyrophosphohydrolase [Saccharothrix coeruleofusca]
MTAVATPAVVLLDDRLPDLLPAAALPVLRAATAVYAGEGVPLSEGVDPAPEVLPPGSVLLTTDLSEPRAARLVEAGARVVRGPEPEGAELLEVVSVMDRLRSPGGCPWDAEQDHKSLRQYLVEETYELLEAIEDGDRAAMREELGDVLLQVLFHARIAAEHAEPFGIDEVAADLVAKLVGRHPHVFQGGDPAVHDATSQQHRWEELKQVEKRRESSLDGVASGQPAVALAGKLAQRASRAGLPADLLPGGEGTGERLFATAALAKLAGEDPETELRAVARAFEARVRAAEKSARAAGVTAMTARDWRAHWPA